MAQMREIRPIPNGDAQNGNTVKSRYSIVVYDAQEIVSFDCHNIDELLRRVDDTRVNWVTVRDVHDEEELSKLLRHFNVDPFILPDILDETQVAFEAEYEDCLYLEYMVPFLDEKEQQLVQSRGSFILTNNALILYEHQLHGLFSRTRRLSLIHI